MQQALSQAERVRREIEQLGRARQGQNGDKPGQQGQGRQQGGQQQGGQQQGGQQQGQQAGNQQGGQQSGGQQAGGQQSGGQQGGSQQAGNQQGGGQQGGNQQTAAGPRGAGGPYGGAYGYNDGPRNYGPGGPVNEQWRVGDASNQPIPANPDAAYSDLMRDIGRLRAAAGDDKDIAREIQDLTKRAQDLDPRHSNNEAQLGAVINGQALSEVDELELIIRRKLQAGDSSVRSASPQTVAPGYADAVAEYNRRLSKQ